MPTPKSKELGTAEAGVYGEMLLLKYKILVKPLLKRSSPNKAVEPPNE